MTSPTISSSAIQVLDGETDITAGIDWKSFDLVMVLTKEKGSLTFDIIAENSPIIPALSDTIWVNYTINGTTRLIFGGTVITREQVIDGGVVQRYTITCADWGYTFDSRLVKKTYANMDPQDIVNDIVTNFCGAGFTTVNVQRGNFLVSEIKFNYQQPSKAIESLAQQIGWDWYIDPLKDLHFFFADTSDGTSELNAAPFDIDDTSGQLEWPTLDVTQDISNLKNSIYVVGGSYGKVFVSDPDPAATPPQYAPVDVYTSVGGTLAYPLQYPYDESTLVITLGGVGQSIGTDLQTDPTTVQVLYNDSGPFIRFTSDPGDGNQIIVQGTARVPILAFRNDPTSISEFGEYQDAIIDSNILSVPQAQARALAEIEMFGHPVYDVKFNSISPLSNQLYIGQVINFNSSKFGVSNYPLVIRRIECVGRSPFQLEYQVEAMGSQTVTFTDMMLYLLQQTNAQTTTTDNTVLQVLIPIEEAIEIGDAVTIIGASRPYAWGPIPSPIQNAEGGATYGSFSLGSAAYGGGLPYADDAPLTTQPEIVWSFFSWS